MWITDFGFVWSKNISNQQRSRSCVCCTDWNPLLRLWSALIYMTDRPQITSVFANQVSPLKRAFNHISLTGRIKWRGRMRGAQNEFLSAVILSSSCEHRRSAAPKTDRSDPCLLKKQNDVQNTPTHSLLILILSGRSRGLNICAAGLPLGVFLFACSLPVSRCWGLCGGFC